MVLLDEEAAISTPLRIASVPADHVYVRHLAAPTGDSAFIRLPEQVETGGPAGAWWPSPVLEPAWLRLHAHTYDLVHVHFGFEHRTLTDLAEFVATLRELGRPLVVTVHDLLNPHLTHQRNHLAALELLVTAAVEVITLTPGAAAAISTRWGRRAVVLPHPHVVPLARLAQPRPAHEGFIVGLHDRQRANCDPDGLRHVVADTVALLPGAALHPGHRGWLSDEQCWDYLAGLDAFVLPYRFGTHSGFVEACHDLGTTVIAPRVGFLTEQQPLLSYDLGEPGSLVTALRTAYEQRPVWRADPALRAAQRVELAAAHAQVYARAMQFVNN